MALTSLVSYTPTPSLKKKKKGLKQTKLPKSPCSSSNLNIWEVEAGRITVSSRLVYTVSSKFKASQSYTMR